MVAHAFFSTRSRAASLCLEAVFNCNEEDAMSKSRISLGVDLEAEGKHVGFGRIPHSVTRSAYGWLPLPMVSIKNGTGKTILLLGGTHGDEYEGQVALARLAREIQPAQIQGQLIIVTMANYPAAQAGARVSPIDGGNLARLYPGDPAGSVTQMIAHFIETELMARCDLVLDLHSGGASLNYLPAVTSLTEPGAELHPDQALYMKLFGAPYALTFSGRRGIGSAADAAARNGILRVGCEMGGRGALNPAYRELCEMGTKRILAHLGVLIGIDVPPPGPVSFYTVTGDCYIYAEMDGLFESAVALGDRVEKGAIAGWMYRPERPLEAPVPVHFPRSGIVVCERPLAMCQTGDCLLHLAF